MNKLENHIFYTICEKSIEMFEARKENQNTYVTFCNLLRTSIEKGTLLKWEKSFLFKLNIYLNKIYGLNQESSGDYLGRFFIEYKYQEFEEPVKLMTMYFRFSNI